MLFLSFADNLLQDTYNILQNSAAYFEVAHVTCPILVWDAVPPEIKYKFIEYDWYV